jgi:hypothetical protein
VNLWTQHAFAVLALETLVHHRYRCVFDIAIGGAGMLSSYTDIATFDRICSELSCRERLATIASRRSKNSRGRIGAGSESQIWQSRRMFRDEPHASDKCRLGVKGFG